MPTWSVMVWSAPCESNSSTISGRDAHIKAVRQCCTKKNVRRRRKEGEKKCQLYEITNYPTLSLSLSLSLSVCVYVCV